MFWILFQGVRRKSKHSCVRAFGTVIFYRVCCHSFDQLLQTCWSRELVHKVMLGNFKSESSKCKSMVSQPKVMACAVSTKDDMKFHFSQVQQAMSAACIAPHAFRHIMHTHAHICCEIHHCWCLFEFGSGTRTKPKKSMCICHAGPVLGWLPLSQITSPSMLHRYRRPTHHNFALSTARRVIYFRRGPVSGGSQLQSFINLQKVNLLAHFFTKLEGKEFLLCPDLVLYSTQRKFGSLQNCCCCFTRMKSSCVMTSLMTWVRRRTM